MKIGRMTGQRKQDEKADVHKYNRQLLENFNFLISCLRPNVTVDTVRWRGLELNNTGSYIYKVLVYCFNCSANLVMQNPCPPT